MGGKSFGQVLLIAGALLGAVLEQGQAAADSLPPSPLCIRALDPTAEGSLIADGNTTVAADCGVVVDSNSPAAVRLKGSASVTSSSIWIVGGFELSGRAQLTPTPNTGVGAIDDPFRAVATPSFSSCDLHECGNQRGSSTLSPGVYCNGIDVGGNAVVTLNRGVYVLQGGGLTIGGDASLTGAGVTFYDTGTAESYRPIIVGGNSTVQLVAPSTGALSDILFFGDRNITSSQASGSHTKHIFSAAAGSTFQGALYFPSQTVSLKNFRGCSPIVADQIEFTEDTQLNCSTAQP